jgi:transposase-like protein
MGKLVEIIALVKELPESYLSEALERVKEIKEKSDKEISPPELQCPHCDSEKIVRNGHRSRKQAYKCHNCGKSFVPTTNSAIHNSHSSATVWKQVICDTVNGVAIDKAAESLDLHHETVFNMRHKILYCVEQALIETPTELTGVCETDETYVLESIKGRKIPENYHRKARKHGAVASKRGISNEYICVCAGVTSEGGNVAVSVNRASPSGQEILNVFGERVNADTVALCDGKLSYNALVDKCTVAVTQRINKVNGFHSFIKKRLEKARGVATIYLNRYNALFSKVYASDKSVVDDIFALMSSQTGSFKTISYTQSVNLLQLLNQPYFRLTPNFPSIRHAIMHHFK